MSLTVVPNWFTPSHGFLPDYKKQCFIIVVATVGKFAFLFHDQVGAFLAFTDVFCSVSY